MTLTKNKMIREIGQRTRLKNRDIQLMLEALVDLWTENLVTGERIELENLFVLETQIIDRSDAGGILNGKPAPRYIRRVTIRTSRRLKSALKRTHEDY